MYFYMNFDQKRRRPQISMKNSLNRNSFYTNFDQKRRQPEDSMKIILFLHEFRSKEASTPNFDENSRTQYGLYEQTPTELAVFRGGGGSHRAAERPIYIVVAYTLATR